MVACSNRMPKCCIIGMHTVCCVTCTEASTTGSVVWLTTVWWRVQTSDLVLSLFSQDYLHLHASVPKINQH